MPDVRQCSPSHPPSCCHHSPEPSSCCYRCISLLVRTRNSLILFLMGRQKVDPRHRQRVAQACDSCKKRKEKCNGALPCEQCKSRRRDHGCRYTRHATPAIPRTPLRATSTTPRHGASEIQLSLPLPEHAVVQQVDKVVVNSDSLPEETRMLKDCQGRFSMSRYYQKKPSEYRL